MKLILSIFWIISLLQVNVKGMESINLEDFLFSDVESDIVIDFTDTVENIRYQLGNPENENINDYGHFSYVLLDYQFLRIGYMYTDEDSLQNTLDALIITNSKVATYRGISIGDNIADVIAKYGDPYFQSPDLGDNSQGLIAYFYIWVPEDRIGRLGKELLLQFIYDEYEVITRIIARRET